MVDYATVLDVIERLNLETLIVKLRSITGTPLAGDTMTGNVSSATAYVDSYDSTSKVVHVAWVSGKFNQVEAVTFVGSSATATIVLNQITTIQRKIDDAESLVDKFCQTRFGDNTLPATENMEAEDDQTEIELEHAPIVSIDTFTVNGTAVGVENTDYWVDYERGVIKVVAGTLAAGDPNNVVVAYTWGDTTVPEGIRNAVVEMVVNAADDIDRRKNIGGATKLSMADFSVIFAKQVMLTEEIENQLKLFRRRRMLSFV